MRQTLDHDEANCSKSTKAITVKIGGATHVVQVPILVNSLKPITAEDEIVLYSKGDKKDGEEPSSKRPKVDAKGKGRGKSPAGKGSRKGCLLYTSDAADE